MTFILTLPGIARLPGTLGGLAASPPLTPPSPPPDQGTVHTVTASGGDDTAAIQAAITAAASGDTIKFSDGTYHVTTLAPKSGLLFKGNIGGNTIIQTGLGYTIGTSNATTADSNNITFYGLTFDGNAAGSRGISFQSGPLTANVANNIAITCCTFQNGGVISVDIPNWIALSFSQFVTISWCSFAGGGGTCCKGDGGVGWGNDNFTFEHNIVHSGFQGVTMNAPTSPNPGRNYYIGYNYFTSLFRMAVEINGDKTQSIENCIAEWNYLENWVANPPIQTQENEGFSIVVDGSTGTIVRNNYMLAGPGLQAVSGNAGYSIELAGGYSNPPGTPQAFGNYLDGSSGSPSHMIVRAIQLYYNGSVIENNNMINHVGTLGFGTGEAGATNTPATSVGTTQSGNTTDTGLANPIPKPACGPTGVAP